MCLSSYRCFCNSCIPAPYTHGKPNQSGKSKVKKCECYALWIFFADFFLLIQHSLAPHQLYPLGLQEYSCSLHKRSAEFTYQMLLPVFFNFSGEVAASLCNKITSASSILRGRDIFWKYTFVLWCTVSCVWHQWLTRIELIQSVFVLSTVLSSHWKIVPQTENVIQNDKTAYPWEQREMWNLSHTLHALQNQKRETNQLFAKLLQFSKIISKPAMCIIMSK